MSKIENLIDAAKLAEMIGKKEEPEKKCNPVLVALAIIGAIAAVAAIGFAIYHFFFAPDYLDDFEDEFDDDFDDEDDEDEDDEDFFVDEGEN